MVGVHAHAEAQGHHIHLVRHRGMGNVAQGRLRAQGDATAAVEREHALSHQQSQAMRFLWKGGQKHARRCAIGRVFGDGADGMTHQARHALGERVFFKHLQLAAHPGVAHRHDQRRHQIGDEMLETFTRQGLAELATQAVVVVRFEQLDVLTQITLCMRRAVMQRLWCGHLGLAQVLKLFHGLSHNATGPVTLVHQALDDAQFLNLCHRVNAFTIGVAAGRWKAVTAFPHAQRVFANAGVALDSSDRQNNGIERFTDVHGAKSFQLRKRGIRLS